MGTDSPPNHRDVAGRLIILKAIVVHAMATPPRAMLEGMRAASPAKFTELIAAFDSKRQDMCKRLEDLGVWDEISPEERTFLLTPMASKTQTQHIDASWRVEAAQALMWAIGIIEVLPPYDASAAGEHLKRIPTNVDELIRGSRLRPKPQLESQRGIAELWHWRSRTRQLIERKDPFPADLARKSQFNSFDDIVRATATKAAADGTIPPGIDEDFPAFGKAYRDLSDKEWSQIRSITVERHFALNWVCGYSPGNRWDETPTGT